MSYLCAVLAHKDFDMRVNVLNFGIDTPFDAHSNYLCCRRQMSFLSLLAGAST